MYLSNFKDKCQTKLENVLFYFLLKYKKCAGITKIIKQKSNIIKNLL
jgi:hypothetical protein